MSKTVTPKRLVKSDFAEIVKIATHYVEPYRTTCGKLIRHWEWARREIEALENDIHELKQQSFYKKAGELASSSPPPHPHVPKATPQKFPLKARLKYMYDNNLVHSKFWKTDLRWSQITHAQALEILSKEFNIDTSTLRITE